MNQSQLFFIVGAQKAGTTSLYRYLYAHPDIHMPLEKEVPFFDKSDINMASWKRYKEMFLTPQQGELVSGTSTPQYMCDHRIPARIAQYVPNAKIIILIRDPIQRAVSHYKMLVRWGKEFRPFENAIHTQLLPENLEYERQKTYEEILQTGEHGSYVYRGEYKPFIDLYRKNFPGAVIVVSSDSLKRDRKKTLQEVFRFLGVRDTIIPETISKEYHTSNADPLERAKKWVIESGWVREIVKKVTPKKVRQHVRLRYFSYLGANQKPVKLGAETYHCLTNHFKQINEDLDGYADSWYKAVPDKNGMYYL